MQKEGFVNRRIVFKPLLTLKHKQARRMFARRYKGWSTGLWKRVIFSDEKIFRSVS